MMDGSLHEMRDGSFLKSITKGDGWLISAKVGLKYKWMAPQQEMMVGSFLWGRDKRQKYY